MCAADVVCGGKSEAQARKAAQRVLGVFIVAVCNDQSVLRDKLCKAAERALHIVQIPEKVQMIRVDVQNDSRCGEEIQKRVAVFTAL